MTAFMEPGAAPVRPTKLFIGGISRQTTTKLLRDHFSDYGQVLDCVAMRQPDGRSRGFGLVTLDSLAAAERCLAEPMVIDGRVVDMKLAVPEGGAAKMMMPSGNNSRAAAPRWTPGIQAAEVPRTTQGLAMGYAPGSRTAMTSADAAKLDCVDLVLGGLQKEKLSAAAPEFVPKGYGAQEAPKEAAGAQKKGKAKEALCASAPEFKPACVKAQAPAVKAQRVRPVPEEDLLIYAEDYVAFLEDQEGMCNLKKKGMLPESSKPKRADVGGGRVPLGEVTNQAALSTQEMADAKKTSSNSSPASRPGPPPMAPPPPPGFLPLEKLPRADSICSTTATVRNASPSSDEEVDAVGKLPSSGSTLHDSGDCRPCNFFPKGRCSSAVDCGFCHLNHEKRKPTRQEKRERQAAWMEKQRLLNGEDAIAEKDDADELPKSPSPKSPTQALSPKRMAPVAVRKQDEDDASDAVLLALKGIELPPRTCAPMPAKQVATPVESIAPAAFAMNFDAFEDSDDSDSEAEAEEEPTRSGCCWSREEILRLRVAMEPRAARAATV